MWSSLIALGWQFEGSLAQVVCFSPKCLIIYLCSQQVWRAKGKRCCHGSTCHLRSCISIRRATGFHLQRGNETFAQLQATEHGNIFSQELLAAGKWFLGKTIWKCLFCEVLEGTQKGTSCWFSFWVIFPFVKHATFTCLECPPTTRLYCQFNFHWLSA